MPLTPQEDADLWAVDTIYLRRVEKNLIRLLKMAAKRRGARPNFKGPLDNIRGDLELALKRAQSAGGRPAAIPWHRVVKRIETIITRVGQLSDLLQEPR